VTDAQRELIQKTHERLMAALLKRDMAADTHEGLPVQLGGTPSRREFFLRN